MNNEKQEQKNNDGMHNAGKGASKVKIDIETGQNGDPVVAVKSRDHFEDVDVVVNGKKMAAGEKGTDAAGQEKDLGPTARGGDGEKPGEDLKVKTADAGDSEKHSDQGSKTEDQYADSKSSEGADATTGRESEQQESKSDNHEKELRKAQQSLLESELKILKLENEIQRLNEQYTKKVTEKAVEAQKLIDKRLAELQEEFAAKAAEAKKYALTKDAGKLAELLQNFEMVLSTSQRAGEAVKNYSQGFVMVFDMMVKTLSELGITPIEINPGDAFDHDTMEIFEGVDSKKFQHNQVVEVLKKGYRLHDKVIAHAIVKVAN